MWFLFLLTLLVASNASLMSSTRETKPTNIICYFASGYGVKIAPPETLDANLCTHFIYAFVSLDSNGKLKYQRKDVDIDQEMYKRFVALKKTNPKLKILLSVASDAKVFSEVAANSTTRRNFAASAANFCKKFGFDGIDIDWERPMEKDADNFIELLKDAKQSLNEENKLLTIAVFPYPHSGYKVSEIIKYVDLINMMCYNYYGPWSTYTGFNSPLFPSEMESHYEQTHLNIAASIDNWIEAGVTKEKLVVGIPFYGRTLTLTNPDDHGFHAPISGGGSPATPSYAVICSSSSFDNYTYVWQDEQKVPYKYYGNQWLSFEDERSIKEKTKYIISRGVAGVMIWQIAQDDMKGVCGLKQGLLRVINDNIKQLN